MRRLILSMFVFLLVFAGTVALAADSGLTGKWQGPISMHTAERGFVSADGSVGMLTIVEEQDGAFYGNQTWTRDGKTRTEEFSGVISPDGKRIYFTGHDDGYFFGEILGPDEMVVYYLEDGNGKSKAMRRHLKKVK